MRMYVRRTTWYSTRYVRIYVNRPTTNATPILVPTDPMLFAVTTISNVPGIIYS